MFGKNLHNVPAEIIQHHERVQGDIVVTEEYGCKV